MNRCKKEKQAREIKKKYNVYLNGLFNETHFKLILYALVYSRMSHPAIFSQSFFTFFFSHNSIFFLFIYFCYRPQISDDGKLRNFQCSAEAKKKEINMRHGEL